MDALVEELQHAHTTAAMGQALLDATHRHVGHSGLSFLRVSGPVISRDDVFATCSREPPTRSAEIVLECGPLADRELGGPVGLFGPGSFDVAERFDPAIVQRSQVFREYWRPLRMERQLVGCLGSAAGSSGFLCVVRSAKESAFTSGDLQAFERIRSTLDRSLTAARHLGRGDLGDTLSLLARATPSPWLVFDGRGHLLWLTEEACARLSLDAWRFGSSIAFRHSAALERLRAWVRAQARQRAPSSTSSPPPDGRIAASGEQFVVRRFEGTPGRPLFLVGFAEPVRCTPGPQGRAAEREASERAARLARTHGLTHRQTEVLARLAHGNANKAIASLLGCAEVTVELHVTALLAKLGCENRAQVVARFWTS